jgi:transcriptional regulator with XRE-family HTH domain
MMPRSPSFGLLLQHYRQNAGLSQEELAERAGLSRRGISDLERGARRSPHASTMRRLAEALCLQNRDRATLASSAHSTAESAAVLGSPITIDFLGPSNAVGKGEHLIRLDVMFHVTVGPVAHLEDRLTSWIIRMGELVALLNDPDTAVAFGVDRTNRAIECSLSR